MSWSCNVSCLFLHRLYVNWRFLRGIEAQFLALQKGFNEVIPQHLLKAFDEKELEVWKHQSFMIAIANHNSEQGSSVSLTFSLLCVDWGRSISMTGSQTLVWSTAHLTVTSWSGSGGPWSRTMRRGEPDFCSLSLAPPESHCKDSKPCKVPEVASFSFRKEAQTCFLIHITWANLFYEGWLKCLSYFKSQRYVGTKTLYDQVLLDHVSSPFTRLMPAPTTCPKHTLGKHISID